MASSEAQLLQAIAADPDDDAARAVLADLLIARGDPRGEMMQLALAPPTKERAALLEALEEEHREAIVERAKRIGRELEWSLDRGLIGGVGGTPSALARHAAEIVAREPFVRRIAVALERGDADLGPALRSPLGAKAHALEVRGGFQKVRGEGWDAVGAMAQLRTLAIGDTSCGPGELAAAFARPLRGFAARNVRWLAKSVGGFAGVPRELRALEVWAGHLGRELGVCVGARCRELRAVALAGNELGDDGFAALAPALAHAETLDLRGNEIADFAALAGIGPQLRELEISGNRSGDEVLALLPRWPNLTRLNLGGLSSAAVRALAELPSLASLTSLVIHGPKLADADKAALVASPHLARARLWAGDRQVARTPPKPPKRATRAGR